MSKGINFKKLRNDVGLTLAHLAELSGYDVTDIVRLEQGEKFLPVCGNVFLRCCYKHGRRVWLWMSEYGVNVL